MVNLGGLHTALPHTHLETNIKSETSHRNVNKYSLYYNSFMAYNGHKYTHRVSHTFQFFR